MPVEIRQVIIKAVVETDEDNNKNTSSDNTNLSESELVEKCVRQVLRILKKLKDR